MIIVVKDSDGEILFREISNGKLLVEKTFDFSSAYADDYTIEVIEGKASFTEEITIK